MKPSDRQSNYALTAVVLSFSDIMKTPRFFVTVLCILFLALGCAGKPVESAPTSADVEKVLLSFSDTRLKLYLVNGEAPDNATLLQSLCRQNGISFIDFKNKLSKDKPTIYAKLFS